MTDQTTIKGRDDVRELTWEQALIARGYRKHPRGLSEHATALFQRRIDDDLFINFDVHDFAGRGPSLTAWMQVDSPDDVSVRVEMFTFKPDEAVARLDAIEKRMIASFTLDRTEASRRELIEERDQLREKVRDLNRNLWWFAPAGSTAVIRESARLAYTPEEIAALQANGEAYDVERVLARLRALSSAEERVRECERLLNNAAAFLDSPDTEYAHTSDAKDAASIAGDIRAALTEKEQA